MSKTIFNDENYEKQINYEDVNKFIIGFNKIINNFLENSIENININEKNYFNHVIFKGINTLTNVFNFLVLYTKNIEIILNACEKSYLYFIEFIGQIGNDSKGYLQLTVKDATLFVYKKTIFDINNEFKKTFELNYDDKIILETINKANKIINLHRSYLIENIKIINNPENFQKIKDINTTFINTLIMLNNDNILNKIEKFNNILEILENFRLIDIEIVDYIFLCESLLKKIKKNKINVRNTIIKINSSNFKKNLKILNKNKFSKWLFDKSLTYSN
jgi:hypothetical protein